MTLFEFNINIDRVANALERIANALDRAHPLPSDPNWNIADEVPPMPDMTVADSVSLDSSFDSESAEFRRATRDLKSQLMSPRMEFNEETGTVERLAGLSEDEADEVVAKAFQLAKAQANAR